MSVEYFGVGAVRDDNHKVAFVFLFSAGFRVFNIDDLVVEPNNSINGNQCLSINDGQVLLGRNNNKLLTRKRQNLQNPSIRSPHITSNLLLRIIQIHIKHFSFLPTKNKHPIIKIEHGINIVRGIKGVQHFECLEVDDLDLLVAGDYEVGTFRGLDKGLAGLFNVADDLVQDIVKDDQILVLIG